MPRGGLLLPIAACSSLFLASSSHALAQTRPLLTEEAATAPAGTVVLEIGGDYIGREPNFLTGRERDRWDAPVLRLVYSPARKVEIDVEWTVRVGVLDDPDFGTVSDFGDVALRAKVNFLGEDRSRPALGARFTVTLPQTSFGDGLGPNAQRMSAQVLVSKTFGGLAVHANAGLAIHDEVLRPHEQRDFLAYGLALVRPIGSAAIVAEVAGRAGDGAPGAEERAEARAGFRLDQGRVRWDAALRRGLADADGGWGITAGVSWTIRP
jgi:hypothetical protein